MCNNIAVVTWFESVYALARMCFVHLSGYARHDEANLYSMDSGRTRCHASRLIQPIFACDAS